MAQRAPREIKTGSFLVSSKYDGEPSTVIKPCPKVQRRESPSGCFVRGSRQADEGTKGGRRERGELVEEGRDPGNGENRNIDEIAAAAAAAVPLPLPNVCINGGNACYLLSLPLPPRHSPLSPSTPHSLTPSYSSPPFSLFFPLVSSISSRFTYLHFFTPAAILSQKDTAISTGAFPYSHLMVPTVLSIFVLRFLDT